MTAIVQSLETVTLVGGGLVANSEIHRCYSLGATLVAADGGARPCLAAGIQPDAVIGDMDSLASDTEIPASRIFKIPEQDSTDFDKALRNIDAPLVLGAGFTGKRADHFLACLNTLVRMPDRRCILLSEREIVFLLPPHLTLDLDPGTTVSLFPLGLVEAVSDGLKWPTGGLSFAPDGVTSTSNMAEGPIEISVTAPKLLMLLPQVYLERVAEALKTCSARWPALGE